MHGFFQFLADNPYILLFFTVGMAVLVGKFSFKGYGLGMVAAAVVVGAALATWASTYGVKLQLDNFAKSLFYYLFMYGVGLRVGPAFFNSLKKDGITFTILAVVCSVLGLALVVLGCGWLGLPAGAAGGVLAGSQTMSAAIGTAEMAMEQGAYKLPAGTTAEQVSGMIALGYGVTYIWGTVGIILVCKYLPRWWGVDARKAAKEYEQAHGVKNVDDAALTGYRGGGLRAYQEAKKAPDMVVALRTDEQGLFCDWEKINDPNFKIFFASGHNFQSAIALTAGEMKLAGADIPTTVDVPFKFRQVQKGMCNPELPQDASVSTTLDDDMLKAMFKK